MDRISLQLISSIVALVVCPIAFFWTLYSALGRGVDNAGFSLLVMFGTIGGFFLTCGILPIPLGLACIMFMVTVVPVVNLLSAVSIAFLKPRSGYDTIAMCFGFVYPFLAGGAVVWSLMRS